MSDIQEPKRQRLLNIDPLQFVPDSAKRELEATAWGVALAAPGLFAGLGQVENLFKATRLPWLFGYMFGTMVLMLVGSIFMGLRNHSRLHSILSLHTSMQSNRLIREAMQAWVVEEWKSDEPDIDRITEYGNRVPELFESAQGALNTLAELQSLPSLAPSIHQQLMLKYAYALFFGILLTSDFSKLI